MAFSLHLILRRCILPMIVVEKKKNETTDKLFRKFTKIFREEDIIFDVNRKVVYKNPALLKKEKKKEKLKLKAQRRTYQNK